DMSISGQTVGARLDPIRFKTDQSVFECDALRFRERQSGEIKLDLPLIGRKAQVGTVLTQFDRRGGVLR
ncbi:MAG: hypothetical protein WCN98_19205, partial [Verrucomicrobiaceae bacterium]